MSQTGQCCRSLLSSRWVGIWCARYPPRSALFWPFSLGRQARPVGKGARSGTVSMTVHGVLVAERGPSSVFCWQRAQWLLPGRDTRQACLLRRMYLRCVLQPLTPPMARSPSRDDASTACRGNTTQYGRTRCPNDRVSSGRRGRSELYSRRDESTRQPVDRGDQFGGTPSGCRGRHCRWRQPRRCRKWRDRRLGRHALCRSPAPAPRSKKGLARGAGLKDHAVERMHSSLFTYRSQARRGWRDERGGDDIAHQHMCDTNGKAPRNISADLESAVIRADFICVKTRRTEGAAVSSRSRRRLTVHDAGPDQYEIGLH